MREIKFRAWGYDVIQEKYVMRSFESIQNNCGAYFFEPQKYQPNPHVLMQYTGLKDKNGKEIYEGDVARQWIEDLIEPSGGFYWLAKIEFYHGAWTAKQIGFDYEKADEFPVFLHDECSLFEVIGNIYENPELL